MGRLFWVGTLLAVIAALTPFWYPNVFPQSNLPVAQTSEMKTVLPAQGQGYTVENITAVAVGAGSRLFGNLTIQGSPSTSGQFYVMTEAQFDSWKPLTGFPTNTAYTGTTSYIYDSKACSVTYPFSFISNSTTTYYFVYQAGQASIYQQGCPSYPSKFMPPRLSVFSTSEVPANPTTGIETLAGVLTVASIISFTANEVGWRRERKRKSTA